MVVRNKYIPIRTQFPYNYKGQDVIVKAACKSVYYDEAEDLRFAFFDLEFNPIKIEFDEAEFNEVSDACIESLMEEKEELMFEQIDGQGYIF